MPERWRQPVIPIAIEQETSLVLNQSGVALPMSMPQLVLKDEDVRRLANGRVCLNCLEPFEEAYPEKCPVCQYPSRKLQALHFSERYKGTETPLTPMDEHRARFAEDDARTAHEPGSKILVPKGFKPASP